VVLQVRADARQIRVHVDAELAQAPGVAHARAQQDRGREDRPCAQDDLVRGIAPGFVTHQRVDARRAAAIEQDMPRVRFAEAVEAFETAMRLQPDLVPATVNLGEALLRLQ